MRSVCLISILMVMTCTAYSQNTMSGVLRNQITHEPISLASVSVTNSNIGTISNKDGAFKLCYSDLNDSVRISHIEYETATLSLADKSIKKEIYLTPKNVILSEVNVKAMSAQDLLLKAIEESGKKIEPNAKLSTYYREFVKNNEQYSRFSDGLVNYRITISKKKIKTDVSVTESRAIKLDTLKEEEFSINSPLDVRWAANIYDISRIQQLIDKDDFHKFNFKLVEFGSDSDLITIILSPKLEIEEELLEKKITLNRNSYLIQEIEMHLPASHAQYAKSVNVLVVKAQITDRKMRIIYKENNGIYSLFYISRDFSMHFWNNKKVDERMRFLSDLIVTDIQVGQIVEEKIKSYKHKSLYKRGNQFDTKFWLSNNSLLLTNEEERIIKTSD
ncbi:carboxypeptidase-like regulatory domain-containing protein [Labilibaculum euxinus]